MKISVLTSTLPFLIIIIMEIKQNIYMDIWEYTKRFLSIDAKPTTSKLNDFTILTTVFIHDFVVWDSLVVQALQSLPAMQEMQVQSLGKEDPLEKEIAANSSILTWRILWTEEPGRQQSMGLHDWMTSLSLASWAGLSWVFLLPVVFHVTEVS